jgi:hypothetical protein
MVTAMAASVTARPGRQPSSGGRLRHRSRKAGLIRAGIAASVAVVGYHAVTFTMAQALKRDPARAYALASYDGRTTARLAAALSGPKATEADRRRGESFARSAMRQDPVSVAAASALGLNAEVRGDHATGRRAFAYAERLSRRDSVTQLWQIEDSVAQGNVRDALHHYDMVLRVKPDLGGILFPVLTAASSDSRIRSEIARTLAARPSWTEPFINYAAVNGTDPRVVATLFHRLERAGIKAPEPARASVLNMLFSNGYVDQAWSYYRSLRPGVSRNRSRDPQFAARIEVPTRFDWVTVGDSGIVGVIEAGSFDFSAPASTGGVMVQQVQLLAPGTYRLRGHSVDLNQPDAALPYWTLTCHDGRELGRVVVPRSGQAQGNFTGTIRVTPDCPIQTLALIARPSDMVSGLSGRIDRAELAPDR